MGKPSYFNCKTAIFYYFSLFVVKLLQKITSQSHHVAQFKYLLFLKEKIYTLVFIYLFININIQNTIITKHSQNKSSYTCQKGTINI